MCLVCQDHASCYFYFILLPLGPEMCHYVIYFCVALLIDLFVLCVACLTVFVKCLVK